jgi:hypothetical protein
MAVSDAREMLARQRSIADEEPPASGNLQE